MTPEQEEQAWLAREVDLMLLCLNREGVTQKELAKRMGVSCSRISGRIDRAKRFEQQPIEKSLKRLTGAPLVIASLQMLRHDA